MKVKSDIARSNRRRGKRVQSKVSKLWGEDAKNTGILGGEDIEHRIFSIESKSRLKCVIEKWFNQAEANCPTGKIPLVHCHILGKKYDGDYIITRLHDFKGLINL